MKKRTLLHRAIRCVIMFAFFSPASCGDGSMNGIYDMFGERPYIFTSTSGSGNLSGSDWANTATLEDAITNANVGQEIWMKAGSYTIATIPAGRKISLYGGFAGNEASRSDRDFTANPTTLLLTVDNGITIEGFDGIGIQMTIGSGSPVSMKNCNFIHGGSGFTMIRCNGTGVVAFSNCRFANNAATTTLVSCDSSAVNFIDCKFEGIGANITMGINCANTSVETVSRCEFTGLKYRAIYVAGGARCDIESTTIRNCTGYGGIYSEGECHITGSTIRDCSSTLSGGGVFSAGILTVKNSEISNNTATGASGGGIYNDTGGTCTIESTTVSGNTSSGGTTAGGGICIMNGSAQATITGCVIDSNTGVAGGGVYSAISVTITDTDITRNTSTGSAGGGIYAPVGLNATNTKINGNCNSGYLGGGILAGGTVTLKNCQVENNYKIGYIPSAGGGIFLNNNAVVSFSNCYFIGNRTSGNGSQICILDFLSSGTISNCTIENDAGNGVYNDGSVTLSGITWL